MNKAMSDVYAVQNPALGATIMWQFVSGYYSVNAAAVPFPLLFIVLPIIYNKELRTVIKSTQARSGLSKVSEKLIQQKNNEFKVITKNAQYLFSDVVIAVGGHSGLNLIEKLGIKAVIQKPSLVGLNTSEDFKSLSGTVIKNASINGYEGDVLFTHFGVSGPLIYTISSIKAFDEMPYKLNIDLAEIQ